MDKSLKRKRAAMVSVPKPTSVKKKGSRNEKSLGALTKKFVELLKTAEVSVRNLIRVDPFVSIFDSVRTATTYPRTLNNNPIQTSTRSIFSGFFFIHICGSLTFFCLLFFPRCSVVKWI
jgi:hypothetical protein